MFKILKEFYIIKKFPRGYNIFQKIFANISFVFSRIIIHKRTNKLTFKDLLKANLELRKGDIVVCGERETVFSDLIGDPVNHAVIYIGKRRFIEAVGKGVGYISFHKLFTHYHSFVILRTVKGTKRKVKMAAVKWAKEQVGKPYDYDFSHKNESYFCSELANEAYKRVGYKTNLPSVMRARSLKIKLQSKITPAAKALRPARMVKGNFRVILISHNLKLKGKELVALE